MYAIRSYYGLNAINCSVINTDNTSTALYFKSNFFFFTSYRIAITINKLSYALNIIV